MNGTFTSQHWHGSSVYEGENALDQERAASMADEGGTAGAIADAREQTRAAGLDRGGGTGKVTLWAIAGIALGAAVFSMLWLRRR